MVVVSAQQVTHGARAVRPVFANPPPGGGFLPVARRFAPVRPCRPAARQGRFAPRQGRGPPQARATRRRAGAGKRQGPGRRAGNTSGKQAPAGPSARSEAKPGQRKRMAKEKAEREKKKSPAGSFSAMRSLSDWPIYAAKTMTFGRRGQPGLWPCRGFSRKKCRANQGAASPTGRKSTRGRSNSAAGLAAHWHSNVNFVLFRRTVQFFQE